MKYINYTNSLAEVVFNEELPIGNYSIEIKVDGYDTFTYEFDFTSEYMGTETDKNIKIIFHKMYFENRIYCNPSRRSEA